MNASRTTVKRRLKAVGLNGRQAVKKPLLTGRHQQLRREFCQEYRNWTQVDWSTVIFTDESKFLLHDSSGLTYVRRRRNEPLRNSFIKPTMKFGGGGVMVWGAIRGSGMLKAITGTLNSEGYLGILGDYLIPTAHMLGYGARFYLATDPNW